MTSRSRALIRRLLPLTCIVPDIVEAILDGRQPRELRLAELLGNGPVVWGEQRSLFRQGAERQAAALGGSSEDCGAWLRRPV